MQAGVPSSRPRGSGTGWAVLNLVIGALMGAAGLLGMAAALGLSVHATDALVPAVLAVAGGLWVLSGVRLLAAVSGGRSARRAAPTLALAAGCALGYVAIVWAINPGDFQNLDLGTAALVFMPGAVAIFGLAEAIYLWRAGTPKAAEPLGAPDRGGGK